MSFTVLDLFSGIGGFAIATQMVGGRTIAFAETSKHAKKVLAARFPNVPNLGDVTKLCRRLYDCEPQPDDDEVFWCPRCNADFSDCDCIGTDQFTDTYGVPDVVVAGVPCQPSSQVGKRMGTADDRWMWPDTIRILRELRPSFGLFENPPAILDLDGGRAFGGILAEMAEVGYDVWWDCVPASFFGAGHRTERLWMVASDSDCAGLEGQPGELPPHEESAGGHVATPNLRDRRFDSRKWYHQSGVQPVADGVSGWMARHALEAIGNAVVPECAAAFLAGIKQALTAQRARAI